jgi:hypothetical protein
MNDRLVEILSHRPDFNVAGEDKKRLDFFAEYLDHGSLFLSAFEPGDDPVFIFSNDAQLYRFSIAQIREYVMGMKSGKAMDWERVPFEYIKRP